MKPMQPFTHEDARRAQLLDGIALDTCAKVAFFEEMVSLAVHFGARNRHRDASDAPVANGRDAGSEGWRGNGRGELQDELLAQAKTDEH